MNRGIAEDFFQKDRGGQALPIRRLEIWPWLMACTSVLAVLSTAIGFPVPLAM
jgi:hypothetical protein